MAEEIEGKIRSKLLPSKADVIDIAGGDADEAAEA
jgi:hypothetical protein